MRIETGFSESAAFMHGIQLTRTICIRKSCSKSGEACRPSTEEITDDRIANLYTAIYKLDPLEKALVTLFLEDFTYEQMAEATGMSANHVGVRSPFGRSPFMAKSDLLERGSF